MYLNHFGLLEAPFSISPDPRYLYMSERHREALAHLLYGLESDGAFILLTGDVGTGKTTVSRCLLEQVPADTNLAMVLNPKVTSIELLQVICDELRIVYNKRHLSAKALVDLINRNLLAAHSLNKKTVVLIEEAQNLDLDVLEQLRLLTNLETNERKLLQVILLGQPEFLDVLDRPELSQLAQRITARFHLGPLKFNEVTEYVAHRLAIAGCRRPLFARGVIKQLYNYSGGVPRLINVICDRALLGCYVQARHQIDKPTLINAAQEVLGKNKAAIIKAKSLKPVFKYFTVSAIILMLIFLGAYFFNVQNIMQAQLAVKPSISIEEMAIDSPEQAETISVISPQVVTQNNNEISEVIVDENTKLKNNQAPVITIENESTENPIQSYIEWPNSIKRLRSNLQSYQSLFERWQLNYNVLINGTPCFFAQTKGLSCLHDKLELDGLRQLNRPAVLTLYNDANRRQYITLLELKKDSAVIAIAGELQHIKLQQLLFYWKGEVSMLWRMPPGYNKLIRFGSAGKAVLWLSQRMNEINLNSQLSQRSYYDEELINQVKAFQLKMGIKNDGVVGIKTLMLINQATTTNTPLLETS